MTDRLSNPNIPVLTNYNWVLWKISIEGYLKQHDLYSFISTREAPPADPVEAKAFNTKKTKASGVLQQLMGVTNYQKFATDTTKDDPRSMWIKLESHYQSKAIANQAKVYNDFLALKFKGSDIDQFITDLTSHICNINAVGLRIGIPQDFEIHENLFCESILDKIPSHLVHTREVLLQNRPLTVEKLTDLLENRRRDDSTVRVKTEESAMKALSRPSKSSGAKCSNGQHNPDSNHLESQCFELYPEQKERMEKRRAKSKAKAKKTEAIEGDSSDVSMAWHCVKRAQVDKLSPNTAYLDGGASHHMISDRDMFTTYSTDTNCKIELADGQTVMCPGMGNVYVKTESGQSLKLECLHVPQLVGNLISEGRLFRRGMDRSKAGPTCP
ncbi:hypothetical protein VP01_1215g2 [Puccinia sorghi]|uniref:Retrovirus-related Pol polyprotein from transposon TNT 1-94-like beta-barrel domain-containing protein n=1 Tax=Puccinia sorghi TaxID=27349 RepID=A0A0L6VQ90_9BASI|nr:hypothetical protein VP01_1215g1 [Puccinia sorghi]KNZ62852.1 hypothetical protein VP01_1215g2 [Puccinia sorghi]